MSFSLVSIIVPVYNCERYLEECINSIINQIYKPIEIILVNDGSTDNSPFICDKYAQEFSNITVIHKTNGGASTARNKGLDNAKGDFIMFVDGDDMLEKDAVANLYNALLHDNTDLAEGLYLEYGNGMKYKTLYDRRRPREKVINSHDAIVGMLQFRLATGCWGKIYRRNAILQKRFPEGQTFNEDMEFLLGIYKDQNIKISLVDSHVYLYRRNPNSVTHTFNEKKFELLDCAEKFSKELSIWGGRELQKASVVYRNVIIANLFISLRRSGHYKQYAVQYAFLRAHLRRNALSYLFGRHYTVKDRIKMLCAFL